MAHGPLPDIWVFADQSGDFQVEQRRVRQLNNFRDGHNGVTVPICILTKPLEDSVHAAAKHCEGTHAECLWNSVAQADTDGSGSAHSGAVLGALSRDAAGQGAGSPQGQDQSA